MSKVEKLKLRDIEVLDAISTMSYGSGSGSGDEGGSGWFSGAIEWATGCPDDECDKNSDCGDGSGSVCESLSCPGKVNPFSYKKCREMNYAEQACEGKRLCDKCDRWDTVYGAYRDGKCSSWPGWPALRCTDTCRS